jgi:hypothetical protein
LFQQTPQQSIGSLQQISFSSKHRFIRLRCNSAAKKYTVMTSLSVNM